MDKFAAAMVDNGIPFSFDGKNIVINGVGLSAANRQSITNNLVPFGVTETETDTITISVTA